jgi:hypothetical protein
MNRPAHSPKECSRVSRQQGYAAGLPGEGQSRQLAATLFVLAEVRGAQQMTGCHLKLATLDSEDSPQKPTVAEVPDTYGRGKGVRYRKGKIGNAQTNQMPKWVPDTFSPRNTGMLSKNHSPEGLATERSGCV